MRADHLRRLKGDVNQRYRDHKAKGWPGWPSRTDEHEQAAIRLEELVQQYGGRDGRMLEIGCGSGELTLLVASKGLFREIYAVDISEVAIGWAKEKATGSGLTVQFQVGDIANLDGIADESFDVVVACACLHWIIGDDRRDCLRSVCRVLRPSGRFYVWTQCRSAHSERDYTGEDVRFDPDSGLVIRHGMPYFHLKTPTEVLSEIREAGLDVLHWEMGPPPWDADPEDQGPLIVVAAKRRLKRFPGRQGTTREQHDNSQTRGGGA